MIEVGCAPNFYLDGTTEISSVNITCSNNTLSPHPSCDRESTGVAGTPMGSIYG